MADGAGTIVMCFFVSLFVIALIFIIPTAAVIGVMIMLTNNWFVSIPVGIIVGIIETKIVWNKIRQKGTETMSDLAEGVETHPEIVKLRDQFAKMKESLKQIDSTYQEIHGEKWGRPSGD